MTSDISLGGCFVLRTPGFEDWHTRRPYPYSQKPERAQGSGEFGTDIALAKRIACSDLPFKRQSTRSASVASLLTAY